MMKKLLLLSACSLLSGIVNAQSLRLPALFTDHMVLQHSEAVRIWGWAAPGERITVDIDGFSVTSRAGDDGQWTLLFPSHHAGGPYRLTVGGRDGNITVDDVWFGDVWVASGQSNMEWKLGWKIDNWQAEIKDSDYPQIRYFEVEHDLAVAPRADLPGGKWLIAGPDTVAGFSAIAWFFAKHNHFDKKVPVGIIDSTWGGTPAEAWTPIERLLSVPGYEAAAREMLGEESGWEARFAENKRNETLKWELIESDQAYTGSDVHRSSHDDAGWPLVELPNHEPLHEIVWLRKTVTLPENLSRPSVYFGDINQVAKIFVNGTLIAEEGWQDTTKVLDIPEGVLKPGDNLIALRVVNTWDNKVTVGRPGELWLKAGGKTINLEGNWRSSNKVEPALPDVRHYEWKPGVLFNAMINPIAGYSLKGFIWYQGESNVDRAEDYHRLFESMITSWRTRWFQGNPPFLYVQLASYLQRKTTPSESDWAELREAQAKTLSLPKTGMAVTIDIGDADDIHPRNKQDVGKRLWLAAKAVAYGDDVVYSGPMFKNMGTQGNKLVLTFDHLGGGLMTKGEEPLGFEVAGADGVFYNADARISKNKILVQAKEVSSPVAVRYAWADNPPANLYNRSGLPAVPFRTR